MPRIYLDNAATSWPKPETVYRAVEDWQRRVGASYARGTSSAADETRAIVARARRSVATLLGESDPRRIVFTSGGTEGLNLALLGLLRPGDHVVATVCEHNAVLRTLHWLQSTLTQPPVETTYVGCDHRGIVDAGEVLAAIRPTTRLVAMIHASNVTGAMQPVEAVAAETGRRGVLLVVDAAQSLGKLPVNVAKLGADIVVAPGHKGLLGPLGTGVGWIREGVEHQLQPIKFGGAASGGDLNELPQALPDRYEAGSLNAPGIAGLAAGVEHVSSCGAADVHRRITQARERLAEGLRSIPGVRLYGPDEAAVQSGVVAFSAEGYDPQELASLLGSTYSIDCRAGMHCAPRLHAALGTFDRGGLVRFSPGFTTTEEDLDQAVEAVRRLLASPLT